MAKKVKKADYETLAATELILATGDHIILGEIFSKDDFAITQDGKQMFVKFAGLLRAAKKALGKIRSYNVQVCQTPEKANGWCSTVRAKYVFEVGVSWSAVADCRETTTQGEFKQYTTAIAETRAAARALRNLLGLEICSLEELADPDTIIDNTMDDPIEEVQKVLIEKKLINQMGKTIADVSAIIGREVSVLEELTKGEAAKVISSFNE